MSAETLAWALKVKMGRAPLKLLLIAVADLANHLTGEVFPSIQYLMNVTGLSKPTVLGCLDELCGDDWQILERTEERKGRTKQIPVYLFHMPEGTPLIEKPQVSRTGEKTDLLRKGSNPTPERGKDFVGKEVKNLTTEPSIRNQEDRKILPLPSEEPPRETNLFDEQVLPVAKPVDLIDHVMSEWAKLKADFPRIQGIAALNDSRKKKIVARAREVAAAGEGHVDLTAVWDMVFQSIRNDRFLRGETPPNNRHSNPFSLNIDKVLATSGHACFLQILERAEINTSDNEGTRDPVSGRDIGPTEQAARRAVERLLARRAGRTGS